MPKKLKIGIVGCGAIGSSLAKIIAKDYQNGVLLVALYDIDKQKSNFLSKRIVKSKALSVGRLEQLIDKSQLVIEASSMRSSFAIAQKTLSAGRDIMVMSVGGILTHIKKLSRLAKKKNSCIYIPSGAVCAIDAVKAASLGEIKSVVLVTRKNPRSLKGLNPGSIKKDRVIFSGSAFEAVKRFPQNINVAAVLSLAGIGGRKTIVKIVVSPSVKRNSHEIKVVSSSGVISARTENVLHPNNPKTSYLAVLSAEAVLKQIIEPVKIGS